MNRQVQPEVQKAIDGMTNWQRNKAGQHCKGAWHKLSLEDALNFATMQKS